MRRWHFTYDTAASASIVGVAMVVAAFAGLSGWHDALVFFFGGVVGSLRLR